MRRQCGGICYPKRALPDDRPLRGQGTRAGTLSVPGGKVEDAGVAADVLEATLRREIAEEVGIQVEDELAYVESKSFVADNGDPCVDIVFLCRYRDGEAAPLAFG
ncbi:MAG TPA: NUDIX domain-containing protein [Thermomicrobiales bacterium]|nr:NUDIX domain-containing protein [Thermomicrobiales bacterium]